MSSVRLLMLSAAVIAAAVSPAGAGQNAMVPAPAAATEAKGDYLIGLDDVIEVSYWRDKDLSAVVAVRPDGFITLPLLRDVMAAGLTPPELGHRIQSLAAEILESPTVTVVVKQINSRKAFITGEVARPGLYVLNGPTTVLQLIAMAGGLTPYADKQRIAIIRTGDEAPLTFNYQKAARLEDLRSNVVLRPGDTVLVR